MKSDPDAVRHKPARTQLLPGGIMLWCLVGLAVGLSVWLGGRTYLKSVLANQLTTTSSEAVALQSIDALLRLDGNATIEVSRGLAHPEFMVANAAYRALGGQLDAWTKLEPADRLQRMQTVVTELERMPEDIDQDHRILVSGLASRIYADTISNREAGAGDVLEACRRILARTDPQHVPTRLARLDTPGQLPPEPTPDEEFNSVPPPLAPLDRFRDESLDSSADAPIDNGAAGSTSRSNKQSESAAVLPKRTSLKHMSLLDQETENEPDSPSRMHLTAGAPALPKSTTTGGSRNSGSGNSTTGMPTLRTQPAVDPHSASDSSRTRVIPDGIQPLPGEFHQPNEPNQPVALSGIEQLPIDQVVRLLASVQPRVSQAAALSLRQRGMPEGNLEVAIQLATGSVEVRQQLLTQLVEREDIDARPWLLWMAADGQDAVRQHAVGLLKPLADSDVRRQLRLLLNKERDENVSRIIRHVLAQ